MGVDSAAGVDSVVEGGSVVEVDSVVAGVTAEVAGVMVAGVKVAGVGLVAVGVKAGHKFSGSVLTPVVSSKILNFVKRPVEGL
ncbi:hypothetical protein HOP50_20g86290 [Chloropicon primus]|nr:hypothetical protein HOP50_20g86290 [Chloropicon primus]